MVLCSGIGFVLLLLLSRDLIFFSLLMMLAIAGLVSLCVQQINTREERSIVGQSRANLIVDIVLRVGGRNGRC